MTKLAKYLKKSVGTLVCIIILLFLQAYCDLALPDYTSRIVNVGIQQGGVEDGVPEKLRQETMDDLKLFLPEEDGQLLENSYEKEQDFYVLKAQKEEEREALGTAISRAEMMLLTLSSDSEQTEAMAQKMQLPPGMSVMDAVRQMPKEQLGAMMAAMEEQLKEMPDTMVEQSAIAFVRAEYEAMGEDLDDMQIDYILMAGVKMLLLAFLGMAATVMVTFLASRMAALTAHDLRNDVYRRVISFTSGEFNQFSTASLITRSTNDIQQIQMFLAMGLRIVLYSPILGIGGILKVVNTDVSMSWVIALAVVLILIVVFVLFKVAMPKFTILQKMIDRLNLVTREILTGIMVTRAFSTEKHEEERFEEANLDLTKTNLFVNRCMTFMMPVMMVIMNGVSVLIVYAGSHRVDAGSMQVGDMMAFIQYAMQIIMSFLMLSMMSVMIPRANVSANRICEVLDTNSSILDPRETKTAKEEERGTVEFDHVSFAYPDADEKVLEDISFTAKKGETVAFIGSTGSGKSTLVNLIPRFYDVTEGAIRVDGVDIREMTQKELRGKLGYVPQKGVLFSGTIASNICYGCEQEEEEAMKEAARIAQAEDFILAKEDGYQSPIAQGGTNVSGGQKQRLSIARAIASKPEILIFDDSFSALDYKTDVALRKALKEEAKDTTTLIVAQRISTILHADQIIVLDEGAVAGKGTHEELMRDCEVYRQIASSQLSEEELAG